MKKVNFIIIVSILAIAVFSCKKSNPSTDLPAVNPQTFTGIKVKGNASVNLKQGPFLVKGSSASETASIINSLNNGNIEIGANFSALIQAPNLIYIEASENATISTDTVFNFLDNLTVITRGNGDINASGSLATGKKLNLSVSESGDLKPYTSSFFSCDEAEVTAINDADVHLKVNNKLNVVVTDNADVYYKGNPIITKQISLNGKLQFVP